MNYRKITRLFVGLFFAILFLWLVVRNLSFQEFVRSFNETNLNWVIAATLFFFVGYAFRVERWRLMLINDNPQLKWINCAGPLFASVAANNILPFRAGDIIRALSFNNRLGITASVSVTTLLMERILDLVVILGLLSFMLSTFNLDTHAVLGIGGLLLALISSLLCAILIFPRVMNLLLTTLEKFIYRFFPNLTLGVEKQALAASALIEHLARKKFMAKLIGLTALAWIAEGCMFWFCALALPSLSEPNAAWLALTVGSLSTVIPSTPGFIGTFDYFTAQSMALMGNELAASVAYAFMVHALLWFIPTLLGGVYLLLYPIGLKSLFRY